MTGEGFEVSASDFHLLLEDNSAEAFIAICKAKIICFLYTYGIKCQFTFTITNYCPFKLFYINNQ